MLMLFLTANLFHSSFPSRVEQIKLEIEDLGCTKEEEKEESECLIGLEAKREGTLSGCSLRGLNGLHWKPRFHKTMHQPYNHLLVKSLVVIKLYCIQTQ